MREGFRFAWHAVRYGVAGCVSTAVAAAPAGLVALMPVLSAVVWVLKWGLVLVVYLVMRPPADLPIDEALGIVLVPVMLVALALTVVWLALLAAAAFTVLVVLPALFVTEVVGRLARVRGLVWRLGSSALAALAVGGGAGALAAAIAWRYHLSASPLALLAVALAVAVLCGCAVFISGLALGAMSFLGEGVVWANRAAGAAEPAPLFDNG